jgi:hypothetical protein
MIQFCKNCRDTRINELEKKADDGWGEVSEDEVAELDLLKKAKKERP